MSADSWVLARGKRAVVRSLRVVYTLKIRLGHRFMPRSLLLVQTLGCTRCEGEEHVSDI